MATADDAELQRAREKIYDTRWERHRDQTLVLLAGIMILALLAAAMLTGNVLFVGAAIGVPAGLPTAIRAVRALPRARSTDGTVSDAGIGEKPPEKALDHP